VVGVIEKDGKYLIQKRPSKGLLAGLWEFPGGKIKEKETPEQALFREIKEELGVCVEKATFMTQVSHAYTRFQVQLHAYACALKSPVSLDKDRHRWITLKGFQRYPLPSGSVKIVRFLENMKNPPAST
jgi:A/G-specific adenine glycosylase